MADPWLAPFTAWPAKCCARSCGSASQGELDWFIGMVQVKRRDNRNRRIGGWSGRATVAVRDVTDHRRGEVMRDLSPTAWPHQPGRDRGSIQRHYGDLVSDDRLAALRGELAPTGTLRASINLGNPVLAQGTAADPTGVTVDIAREIAQRLGVRVELTCFDAARKSFAAMLAGNADVCFLAIEPAREAEVAFSAPYAVIEGVFAVASTSELRTLGDVDRPGVRIGVKSGSAYDLYLTRTLTRAQVVRGGEGIDVYRTQGLQVAAGIRQPMTDYVCAHPDVRLIDERFMQIQQAVGILRSSSAEAVQFLRYLIEELKATGFVADALRRAGQFDVSVAPPAGPGTVYGPM